MRVLPGQTTIRSGESINAYGPALNCRSAGKNAKVSNDRFALVRWAPAKPGSWSSLKEQSQPEQLLFSTRPDLCLSAGPQSESAPLEVWTTALPCICQVVQHRIFDAPTKAPYLRCYNRHIHPCKP